MGRGRGGKGEEKGGEGGRRKCTKRTESEHGAKIWERVARKGGKEPENAADTDSVVFQFPDLFSIYPERFFFFGRKTWIWGTKKSRFRVTNEKRMRNCGMRGKKIHVYAFLDEWYLGIVPISFSFSFRGGLGREGKGG